MKYHQYQPRECVVCCKVFTPDHPAQKTHRGECAEIRRRENVARNNAKYTQSEAYRHQRDDVKTFTETQISPGLFLRKYETDTAHSWQRFKVGSHVQRKLEQPVYLGGKLVKHIVNGESAIVFLVAGFGETEEEAMVMAKGKI